MTAEIKPIILTGADLDRIKEAGGELAEFPGSFGEQWGERGCCPAIEVDGKVVAYWGVFWAVHAEPMYVAPEHRNPGVIRALIGLLEATLAEMKVDLACAVIEQEQVDTAGRYAQRLGFKQVDGSLFYLTLADVEPEVAAAAPSASAGLPPDYPG